MSRRDEVVCAEFQHNVIYGLLLDYFDIFMIFFSDRVESPNVNLTERLLLAC